MGPKNVVIAVLLGALGGTLSQAAEPPVQAAGAVVRVAKKVHKKPHKRRHKHRRHKTTKT